MEFLLIKNKRPLVELSPLFLYYNERKLEGSIHEDSGAMIETGIKLLKDLGVARESLWAHDDSNDNNPETLEKFQISPPKEAFQDATHFRVKEIKALKNIRDIKYSLAHGNPVVFGMEVYQDFYDTEDGQLQIPNPKRTSEGGHAVFAVGYDNQANVFIVKNSWGDSWGDGGYFYLPYEYVRLGLVSEAFTANL